MVLRKKHWCQVRFGATLVVLGLAVAIQRSACSPQTTVFNAPVQTVFAVQQSTNHLGGGASLSPDGGRLVYVADDNALYLLDLSTGQRQALLEEAGPGIDVSRNPAFSSDGTQVLVSMSGGTVYYASNIYSLNRDGSGFKRLTQAQELPAGTTPAVGNAIYAQYFPSAQFSPDGTKVLLQVYDSVQGADNAAVMNADGSQLQVLTPGTPLFWSSDGQSFYYSQANAVKAFSLATKTSATISGLNGRVLGRLPDKEWFGVDDGQSVSLVSVQDSSATFVATWNIPRVKTVGSDQLVLNSFQWTKSGRVLLLYQGERTERFEVVN